MRPNKDLYYLYVQVRKSLEVGNIEAVLDPSVMKLNPNMESVWRVAELAIQSVEPKGVYRPFMRDVVRQLREAFDLEMGGKETYSSKSQSNSNGGSHGGMRYNNHTSMASLSSLDKVDASHTFMGDSETSYPHPR